MRGTAQIRTKQWAYGGDIRQVIDRYGHSTALLAMYLQTGPMCHMCGLYYLPYHQISMDLSIRESEVENLIRNLEEVAFLKYDRERHIVWVIHMARDQVGNGKVIQIRDNKIKQILCHVDEYLPDSPLCDEFIDHYHLKPQLVKGAKGWEERHESRE